MLMFLKKLGNRKGQGIVEFALILAFCTVIGYAASNSELYEEIGNAFFNTLEMGLNDTREGNNIANTGDQNQPSGEAQQ